jgi:hypothetical protein
VLKQTQEKKELRPSVDGILNMGGTTTMHDQNRPCAVFPSIEPIQTA